ncbi:MAG: response regulator, partial [Burkholderiaceae bacterium]|nr:response regulator [Burkholderiaceae bacterium]
MLRNPFIEGAVAGAPVAAPFVSSMLDQMPNSVLVFVGATKDLVYANAAAEASLDLSRKSLQGLTLYDLFGENQSLNHMIDEVFAGRAAAQRQELVLYSVPGKIYREPLAVHVVIAMLEDPTLMMMEWFPIDQQLRSERDERVSHQVEANKQLMRNLAHEIKNPLGGIRGAAQLLEFELPEKGLREYTQVIIKESDRLQTLVDRLLAPHRKAHAMEPLNIHEVLERIRSLVLAEFPQGLKIIRNYDTSLPDILGDQEQLIQAVLNIVHNAAQALSDEIRRGTAQIELRTRVARSVTIAKQRHRLALDLHLISDIRMPRGNGIDLLQHVKASHPDLPVIIMTAYSDLESAVSSFQSGAFEYLTKPFDIDKAVELIHRAVGEGKRSPGANKESNAWLQEAPEIIGQAPAMQEVFRAIGRLSRSHATVLINGESGSGKELVASALHKHSPRADKPFIAINTAAIPKDLLESELFGHERGAF